MNFFKKNHQKNSIDFNEKCIIAQKSIGEKWEKLIRLLVYRICRRN